MNTVYKEMRETFNAEESYSGSQILQAILGSIKVSICPVHSGLFLFNVSGGLTFSKKGLKSQYIYCYFLNMHM